MVYGDGNQDLVTFTRDGDVIAHEITHGVTEKTIDLQYHVQPGALNEFLSDVFGSMFKQYELNQLSTEADWLIGDFMIPDKPGKKKKQPIKQALRSMKDEVAYDNKRMGKDTQPKYMKDYKDLPDDENNDYGGVHDNSGIPNHWFHRAATGLGGYSWEKMGQIVYRVMDKKKVTPEATFTEFAAATIASAKKLYGEGAEVMAVTNAWRDIGVLR
jgi:Zn-dependent metalloprotease